MTPRQRLAAVFGHDAAPTTPASGSGSSSLERASGHGGSYPDLTYRHSIAARSDVSTRTSRVLPVPRTILTLTDLSPRYERVLRRAAMCAEQLRARLALLYVVDSCARNLPRDQQFRRTAALLASYVGSSADPQCPGPEFLVKADDPVKAVLDTISTRGFAPLIVAMDRQSGLRGVLAGTLLERILRTSGLPVLAIASDPSGPYRRILLALDASEASARAVRRARALGFLMNADVTVLHAFVPYAKGKLGYVGADQREIARHVARAALDAAATLVPLLHRERLLQTDCDILLEEGNPLEAIPAVIRRQRPDLLILGMHTRRGLARFFFGSTASAILRHVDCDVLVVPSRTR